MLRRSVISDSLAAAIAVVVLTVGSARLPLYGGVLIPIRADQVPGGGSVASLTPAEAELRTGIALAQRGLFTEAMPHLLAARGHVSDEYAASFDLALCYVATGQVKIAIQILNGMSAEGKATAEVENLLAQAYIGNAQSQEAFEALQKAAALTPQNEKLYLFVADACMDRRNYGLGLKVADLGLRSLPHSARLHYQRGVFLAQLDRFDLGKAEFDIARTVAPESDTAYMAATQKDFFEGNMTEAVRTAREGVKKGYENYILLATLGEALIRSGITAGQPEFAEAQAALEKSVAKHPNYLISQLALGELYLMAGRLDDAIMHLETARQLDLANTSVYSHLATAYRRQGKLQEAQNMLAILAGLNQAQAEKIRSAPGDRKMSYGSGASESEAQEPARPEK